MCLGKHTEQQFVLVPFAFGGGPGTFRLDATRPKQCSALPRGSAGATAPRWRRGSYCTSLSRMAALWRLLCLLCVGRAAAGRLLAADAGARVQVAEITSSESFLRGNHLSNTTRLTQGFFKSGESCSKLW